MMTCDKPVKVFLSGMISNDPAYRGKFAKAAEVLKRDGCAVMNPAMLPSYGFTHDEYMKVTLAMLSVCDSVCLLPDWINSKGAQMEVAEATRNGQHVFTFEDYLAQRKERMGSLWTTKA